MMVLELLHSAGVANRGFTGWYTGALGLRVVCVVVEEFECGAETGSGASDGDSLRVSERWLVEGCVLLQMLL